MTLSAPYWSTRHRKSSDAGRQTDSSDSDRAEDCPHAHLKRGLVLTPGAAMPGVRCMIRNSILMSFDEIRSIPLNSARVWNRLLARTVSCFNFYNKSLNTDMVINVQKSACIRFGLRSKNTCANVVAAGVNIWVTSTRYLGVYIESSVRFKCSFSKNKAGFYRSFNAIFGKIGWCATEEVVLP